MAATIDPVTGDVSSVHAGPALADLGDLAARRASGRFELDEWGLDRDALRLAGPLAALRWRIEVETAQPGAAPLPDGPVLVVFSRAVGISEPFVVAAGLGRASRRPVRVVGAPDVAPLGWWLRRLGAVLDRPEEVRGLLSDGQVVAAPLGHSPLYRRRPGHAPRDLLAVAIAAGAPIVGVATVGLEVGRRWRLRVTEPIHPTPPPGRRRTRTVVSDDVLGRIETTVHDRIDALLG